MNYDYEGRRLKIVTWILVGLLILSIVGASLLFTLTKRTPTETLNTVDVGSRITGGGLKLIIGTVVQVRLIGQAQARKVTRI